MKKHFPLLSVASVVTALAAVSSLESQPTSGVEDSALPAPWKYHGVGLTKVAGGARVAADCVEVVGGGGGVKRTEDACQFAHQSWLGDGVFVARVLSLGGTNSQAAAGLMVRASLEASAPNVFLALTTSNGVSFSHRAEAQTLTEKYNAPGLPLPDGRVQSARGKLSAGHGREQARSREPGSARLAG